MHLQSRDLRDKHVLLTFGQPCHAYPLTIGFTLVELLTVVAVTCVLIAAAIPSFTKLIRANRLTSESRALLSLLMLGRSEAVKRVQQTVLCKSGDGVRCSTAPGLGWNQGMILFSDANADRVLDATDWVVRSEVPFSSADPISFSAGSLLVYRPDGTSSGGTFTIGSGDIQKKVVVSLAGRARVE